MTGGAGDVDLRELSLLLEPAQLEALIERLAARVVSALQGQAGSGDRWPAYMRAETAAEYLDVSVERIRKLKERREIPFVQEAPGRRVLFARSDLDAWMTSMSRGLFRG